MTYELRAEKKIILNFYVDTKYSFTLKGNIW